LFFDDGRLKTFFAQRSTKARIRFRLFSAVFAPFNVCRVELSGRYRVFSIYVAAVLDKIPDNIFLLPILSRFGLDHIGPIQAASLPLKTPMDHPIQNSRSFGEQNLFVTLDPLAYGKSGVKRNRMQPSPHALARIVDSRLVIR
jgi:hypothetical protein